MGKGPEIARALYPIQESLGPSLLNTIVFTHLLLSWGGREAVRDLRYIPMVNLSYLQMEMENKTKEIREQ